MTSIKETVERLRNDMEHFTAEGNPLRFEAAALIERLAGALEEIGKRYDERSQFDGPSFMADEMANIARCALSGEPTP